MRGVHSGTPILWSTTRRVNCRTLVALPTRGIEVRCYAREQWKRQSKVLQRKWHCIQLPLLSATLQESSAIGKIADRASWHLFAVRLNFCLWQTSLSKQLFIKRFLIVISRSMQMVNSFPLVSLTMQLKRTINWRKHALGKSYACGSESIDCLSSEPISKWIN